MVQYVITKIPEFRIPVGPVTTVMLVEQNEHSFTVNNKVVETI